jgi:hypothetical protein
MDDMPVIFVGISSLYPTYPVISTGNSLCRKRPEYDGALDHMHAQASVEAEHYLISR